MKRFPIFSIILIVALTMTVVSTVSHALTNKVILNIEGMT
jgi:hypothetical protein